MPPEFTAWLDLASPDWEPSYPLPGDIRRVVIDALTDAQRGLCLYCGRRLHPDQPGRLHIEHFRPQSTYPDLAVNLANLFLSCGPEAETGKALETCGHVKGDWFDETQCIEPDYPDCTHRFRFLLTGEVAPDSEEDVAAEIMIDILNLNHRELRKDREDILDRIDGESLGLPDFVDSVSGMAQSYAHVVCKRLGTLIP